MLFLKLRRLAEGRRLLWLIHASLAQGHPAGITVAGSTPTSKKPDRLDRLDH
jgi:hypothetical protein